MRARQEEWRDRASCKGSVHEGTKVNAKGEVVNKFFPKEAKGGTPAKKVCAKCPVKKECKADHHKQPAASQHFGVWYNTTPLERENERKRSEHLPSR